MTRALLLLVFASACGGGGSSGAMDAGAKGKTCVGTVGGNVTSTLSDCTPTWTTTPGGEAAITMGGTFPDGAPVTDYVCSVTVSGDAADGSYGATQVHSCGMAQKSGGTQHTYAAIVDGMGVSIGSLSFSISGHELFGATASGSIWTLHGTMDTTLVPLPNSGDTGSLTVQATF